MGFMAKRLRIRRGPSVLADAPRDLEPRRSQAVRPRLERLESRSLLSVPSVATAPRVIDEFFSVPALAQSGSFHVALASPDGQMPIATTVNVLDAFGRTIYTISPMPGESSVRVNLGDSAGPKQPNAPVASYVEVVLVFAPPKFTHDNLPGQNTTPPDGGLTVFTTPFAPTDSNNTVPSPPPLATPPVPRPSQGSPTLAAAPASPIGAPTVQVLGVAGMGNTASVSIMGAPTSSPSIASGSLLASQVEALALPTSGSLAMGPLPLRSAGPFGGVLERGDMVQTVEARVADAVDLALLDLPRSKAPADRAGEDMDLRTVEWSSPSFGGSVAVLRGSGGFPLIGSSVTPARPGDLVEPLLIGGSVPVSPAAENMLDSSDGKIEDVSFRDRALRRLSVFAGVSLAFTFASRAVLPGLLDPVRAERPTRSILRRWRFRNSRNA
jgi:hypothetical protein